jgi:hypothetical protein
MDDTSIVNSAVPTPSRRRQPLDAQDKPPRAIKDSDASASSRHQASTTQLDVQDDLASRGRQRERTPHAGPRHNTPSYSGIEGIIIIYLLIDI